MADFSITGEVRLNSDPAEKSTSKWTIAAGQMIADFAKQASSKLAEVVKSGVDYNATMESYLTNFKVMLGSEEAAATKLSEIRKMAASTPFSLDDLTGGTQTLLQFGIAADDTTGVLQRLGDISLGNAEKLQTLTRAYGKMSSAQKVTLENVNMMIDAGFNPLNQICDATGESMSDLYKRISDGKVSFSELEAAVEAATSQGGQFYNGMLEASQTFSGRMSTLKDNVSALTGELTSGLFAALGDLVVKLNEVVVSFLDSDEKMAQLKETIGIATAVVAAAGTAFLTYKGYVAAATAIEVIHTAATTAMTAAHKAAEAGAKGLAVAQAALNAVMKANTVGIVVSAVAALAAGLVTAYKTSETFRNFVGGAFQFVANIAKSTIGAAIGWLDQLSYKLNNFLGKDGYTGFDSYDDYKASKTPAKSSTVTDADRARRQKLHAERVKQAQEEAAAAKASAETISQSAGKAASAVSTSGKKASASTKAVTASVVKSISDTTTTVKDGITRTVETVNETLSNGKQQQKQTITETSRQMVDGVLKDVKTITEVAADGTETAVTSRKTLDKSCTLTPKLFFQAAAQLGAMNADPIGDSYIAIIHPYAAYDLKTCKEFMEVHKYADPDTMFRGEIGKLGNIRFIETSEAKIWKDDTCPTGLAVFGTLVLGAHAYGVTELEGGGLEHIVKQLGYGDDPLNQRASVGWKGMRAAERLVEQYMVRIESVSSYSATAAAN